MEIESNTKIHLVKQLVEQLSIGTTKTMKALKNKELKGKITNILTTRLLKMKIEDPEKAELFDKLEKVEPTPDEIIPVNKEV